MSKDMIAGRESWEDLKIVDEALRLAKVPTEDRYWMDEGLQTHKAIPGYGHLIAGDCPCFRGRGADSPAHNKSGTLTGEKIKDE